MSYDRERLGEILLRAGLLSPEQLEEALAAQKREGSKLGSILVRELVLTEEQIAGALAEQKGLTQVNLSSYPIDRQVALILPVGMARRRQVIPIARDGENLVLAMADPLDVEAIDEAELRTGMKVVPVVAAESQVRQAVERFVAGGDALQGLDTEEEAEEALFANEVDASVDGDVPVVRMVNQLLREAVGDKASDIHFEPGETGVRVRYRVDGVLREAALLPKASQPELLSRIKVMADLDITERRRPQDGRIGLKVDGRRMDIRVATLPTPLGEAITLRVLDSEVSFHTMEQLGMGDDDLHRLRRMVSRPYGAIFISGPTGSGKSTTLYAMLSEINDPGRKIITVEDPVEYRMEGITQIGVNTRVGVTFAAGLRTILRSDPDVVMVGEVRDPETAETAVRAALTGHLVLTSIHTNDAVSALNRLNDMGVPPYITSSGLTGAVAQRLVRVLCPFCKERVATSFDRLLEAGFTEVEALRIDTYGPVGCGECSNTGFKGRIGVFEVLEFDEEIRTAFMRHASTAELTELAVTRGMRIMRRDALDKVAQGITSLEEADRVVV